MTSTSCYPWWHAKLANAPKTIVSSGCPTVNGNVQCEPEAMRANAEAQLAAAIRVQLLTGSIFSPHCRAITA